MHFLLILSTFLASIFAISQIQLTNEWQIIPDDVTIPPGAHIKLDMETGLRLAKLSQDSEHDSAVIVRPDSENLIENESEHAIFVDAINCIQSSSIDNKKLEDLADLAHDLKFGQKIIQQAGVHLLKIIDNEQDYHETIRDVTARILGASTRNNPGALNELFNTSPHVVEHVIRALKGSKELKISSRLVSVLSCLVENPRGFEDFIHFNGDDVLKNLFISSIEVKSRIVDFIEDHIVSINDSNWRRQQIDVWWNVLQNDISNDSSSADTKLRILKVLTEMKQKSGDGLTTQKEFISWLAKQAIRSTDESLPYSENELIKYVKEVRHSIFGNPKATRKQFDEL